MFQMIFQNFIFIKYNLIYKQDNPKKSKIL